MKTTIPDRGDIILADLGPTKGHEQSGNRPSLVLSRSNFNLTTGLIIICPITSRARGSLFEVEVKGEQTEGVVLTHQVKSIDLEARRVKIVDKVDNYCLQEVIRKVKLIIE